MSERSTTPSRMYNTKEVPSTPLNQKIKKLDEPPQLNRKLRVKPVPFAGNFEDEPFVNLCRRINLIDAGRFGDVQ